MIDYLMVRKTDCCLVKDVKVISSEECVPQHRMVIGRLVLPMKPQKKKIDLWTDPAGVTALLARWTEKLAGGPQAGTSDSPH